MLAPNQIVRVRSRQYLIESIEAPPKTGDSTLVRLSCLEDDASGEKLEVLWEREVDTNPLQSQGPIYKKDITAFLICNVNAASLSP